MGSAHSKCADDPESCCFDPTSRKSAPVAESKAANDDGVRAVTSGAGDRKVPLEKLPRGATVPQVQEYVSQLGEIPGLDSGALELLDEMQELLKVQPTEVFKTVMEVADAFTPAAVYVGPALVFVSMIMERVTTVATNPVDMRRLAVRLRAFYPVLQAAAKLPIMVTKFQSMLSELTKVFKEASNVVRQASTNEGAGWWVKFWNAPSIKSKLGASQKNLDDWIADITPAFVVAFGEETQERLNAIIKEQNAVSKQGMLRKMTPRLYVYLLSDQIYQGIQELRTEVKEGMDQLQRRFKDEFERMRAAIDRLRVLRERRPNDIANASSSGPCYAAAPGRIRPVGAPAPDIDRGFYLLPLCDALSDAQPVNDAAVKFTVSVVAGKAGTGKSVAAQYVLELADDRYPTGCLWVDASSKESFTRSLCYTVRDNPSLQTAMGPRKLDDDVVVNNVLEWLKKQPGRWLFIADNVVVPESTSEDSGWVLKKLMQYLHESTINVNGHVIITTRCAKEQLPETLSRYVIEGAPLSSRDSAILLLYLVSLRGSRRGVSLEALQKAIDPQPLDVTENAASWLETWRDLGGTSSSLTAELAARERLALHKIADATKYLHGVPRAISLAASSICSINQASSPSERFSSFAAELDAWRPDVDPTIHLSLQRTSEAAKELLHIIALCSPNNIPVDLIAQVVIAVLKKSAVVVPGLSRAQQVQSWLQFGVSQPACTSPLAELVQRDLVFCLDRSGGTTSAKGDATGAVFVIPEIQSAVLAPADSGASAIIEAFAEVLLSRVSNSPRPELDDSLRHLQPHFISLCSHIVNNKCISSSGAALLVYTANANAGCPAEKAISFLEAALKAMQPGTRYDNMSVRNTNRVLGRIHKDSGNIDVALRLLQKLVAVEFSAKDGSGGAEGWATRETLGVLGHALCVSGDTWAAEPLFRFCVYSNVRKVWAFDASHVADTLQSVTTFCDVLLKLGYANIAAELLERAIKECTSCPARDHVILERSVALSKFFLGCAHLDQGKLSEAEALFSEAMPILRADYGETHNAIICYELVVGRLTQSRGHLLEAEVIFRRVHNFCRVQFGARHAATRTSVVALGELLLLDCHRREDAQRLLDESLAACPMRFLRHPDALTCIAALGRLHFFDGRLSVAAEQTERALRGRLAALGSTHPDTLASMVMLGLVWAAQGQADEAALLLRNALIARRVVLGDAHPDTLASFSALGGLLLAKGVLLHAEPLLRASLAGRRHVLGDAHPDTLSSVESMRAALKADLHAWATRILSTGSKTQVLSVESIERFSDEARLSLVDINAEAAQNLLLKPGDTHNAAKTAFEDVPLVLPFASVTHSSDLRTVDTLSQPAPLRSCDYASVLAAPIPPDATQYFYRKVPGHDVSNRTRSSDRLMCDVRGVVGDGAAQWLHPNAASTYVVANLCRAWDLHGYSIMTGNSDTAHDPSSWLLEVMFLPSAASVKDKEPWSWVIVHATRGLELPTTRNETCLFKLVPPARNVIAARLTLLYPRGSPADRSKWGNSNLQIGHLDLIGVPAGLETGMQLAEIDPKLKREATEAGAYSQFQDAIALRKSTEAHSNHDSGGAAFDDFDDHPSCGKMKSIEVYHGNLSGMTLVTGFAVTYEEVIINHGGSNENSTIDTFVINEDEFLIGIEGSCGALLDSLQFILSSGRRSDKYGGNGGAPFALHRAESFITAFFGRHEIGLIHGIGVYYNGKE